LCGGALETAQGGLVKQKKISACNREKNTRKTKGFTGGRVKKFGPWIEKPTQSKKKGNKKRRRRPDEGNGGPLTLKKTHNRKNKAYVAKKNAVK